MIPFSASNINRFVACKYSYYLRYIKHHKPIVENELPFKLGRALHKVCEKFYTFVDIKTTNPEAQFVGALNSAWEQFWDKTIDAKLSSLYKSHLTKWATLEAKRMRKYILLGKPEKFMPVATEYDITDKKSNVRAIIDRLGATATGDIYVIDYKAGKGDYPPEAYTGNHRDIPIEYRIQAATNAIALSSKQHDLKTFYLQFLGNPEDLMPVPISPSLVKETQDIMHEIVMEHKYPRKPDCKGKSGKYPCDMRSICMGEDISIHCIPEKFDA